MITKQSDILQHKLYSVEERSPERLSISRRKEREVPSLVGLIVLFSFLILCVYFSENKSGTRNAGQQLVLLVQNPFALLFVLAPPAVILYCILKTVRLLITGEQFVLDKADGHILRNGIVKLKLESVSHLRVRRHVDADLDVDYQLSIVHTGKQEMQEMIIDRDWDQEGILQLAEEIASFLNKQIESL